MFGVYLFSLLTSFIVSQGIQFDFSLSELNNFDNKINIGFQLTDLIELSDNEEETESKIDFTSGFIKDIFRPNFYNNIDENKFSISGNFYKSNFSKLPKYILFHQLIVYS